MYMNVLLHYQDPELQLLPLMECINETSFEKYRLQNGKCHDNCAYTLYKTRYFVVDCREI